MSYAKDVKLKAGIASYYFKHLEWDTRFFGRNSFILDTDKSLLKPSKKIKDLFEHSLKNSFITAKIEADSNKELLSFLQDMGLRYIGMEVILRYNNDYRNQKYRGPNVKIYEAKRNTCLSHKKLGSSFDFSRFHLDVNVSRQKADSLWFNYLKHYRPSSSKHMFVAKYKKRPAGVILVNLDRNKKKANFFFVTVIGKFRGMGIGSQLLSFAADRFEGYEITTETQVNNIKALNFYISNGFSIIKSVKIILHKWS